MANINKDDMVDLVDLCGLSENWLCRVIPRGQVSVDGRDDEWGNAIWMPLGVVYYKNPEDVEMARFAVRWDESTQKIYVVVVVEDLQQDFVSDYKEGDYWAASDRIEVYAQGSAAGGEGWQGSGEEGRYDLAQQYMIGPNNSGGWWQRWALGQVIEPNAELESAVNVHETTIVYEVGLKMFDFYGARAGGQTIPTHLETGLTVGFDVVVDTVHPGIDGFGMLSENRMRNKSVNADNFAKYVLVD